MSNKQYFRASCVPHIVFFTLNTGCILIMTVPAFDGNWTVSRQR